MTDRRGRHGANFQGGHLQVSGDDGAINNYLDMLDQIPQCKVLARIDKDNNEGVIFIQAAASNTHRLAKDAHDRGLEVLL